MTVLLSKLRALIGTGRAIGTTVRGLDDDPFSFLSLTLRDNNRLTSADFESIYAWQSAAV